MDSREFDLLRNKAALGNVEGQLSVANAYSDGLESVGVKPNAGLAVKWYGMAAEQGSGEAQYALSYYQSRGLGGLERNQKLANQLLEKAAYNGHPKAQHWLGKQYENKTNGFDRDYGKAFACYEASAEQGYPLAQYEVGRHYHGGKFVHSCTKTAMRWYSKSAEQGEPMAMYELGQIYEAGDRLVDIAVDMDKAAQMYRAAAEKSHEEAHLKMASFYFDGEGVERDYAASFKHYEAAAISSDPSVFAQAMLGLGIHYVSGEAVPADNVKAARCFKEAADVGSREANYELGVLYSMMPDLEGGGVERAVEYLKIASDANHSMASLWLGDMYANGWEELEKDAGKAVEYYTKASRSYEPNCSALARYRLAGVMRDDLLSKGECSEEEIFSLLRESAELGYPDAKFHVGFHYLKGQGVVADPTEAAYWLKQAADEGYDGAKYQLADMHLNGTGVHQSHDRAYTLFKQAADNGYSLAIKRLESFGNEVDDKIMSESSKPSTGMSM